MSQANAARRNRALRKIRAALHVDPEIKLAIEVILDLLSHKSGYCIAWPSAATIAKRLNNGRRTGQWYVRIIKALKIFTCTQLSPKKARAYCKQKYGFEPNLDRCVTYAPILFEPDLNHSLWDSSRKLPAEVDEEMGEIIREIKARRSQRRSRFCLATIRTRIRKTHNALRDDVANDAILTDVEEERWYRERMLDDVANDDNIGVANDDQVFRLSSDEANEASTPSVARLQKPEPVPSMIPSPKGPAVRQPRSQALRANIPPTRHSAARHSIVRQTQSGGVTALAGSECRFAAANIVENGFAVFTNSGGTVPIRHQVPEQGIGRSDSELVNTMNRLDSERAAKHQRLADKYSNRPDAF